MPPNPHCPSYVSKVLHNLKRKSNNIVPAMLPMRRKLPCRTCRVAHRASHRWRALPLCLISARDTRAEPVRFWARYLSISCGSRLEDCLAPLHLRECAGMVLDISTNTMVDTLTCQTTPIYPFSHPQKEAAQTRARPRGAAHRDFDQRRFLWPRLNFSPTRHRFVP
jgi:hypothetical protein